jgi:MFS family permease
VYSFDQSRASINTGIVMGVSGLPVLFLAIPAGAIADRFDRRKLLIWIQVVLLIQAAALGVLYNSHILGPQRPMMSIVLVSALGLVGGIFVAFQGPSFQSLLPDLVPRQSLMNAIALNSAQFQSSRMLGPALVAGLVLLDVGMGTVFYVNAATFLFVIAALAAIRPRAAFDAGGLHAEAEAADRARVGQGREGAWKTLTAGVAYARENRAVGLLIASTALLTILGFPYMTLLTAIVHTSFPAYTDAQVGREYSIIYAFNGLGALVGALGVASLPSTIPRNRIIPLALLAFAAFITAFSQVHSVFWMIVFSTLAGAALMSTNSLVLTSIQIVVPGFLRGRVMALFMMSFLGIMPVSALLFGAVGQAIGPDEAVLVGGVLLLAWAALLAMRPGWLQVEAVGVVEEPSEGVGGAAHR